MSAAESVEEEITQLRSLALAGAGALRTGRQWEAWLHRAERFADLGFVNTMLTWAQCPEAIVLHDYAEWKRLGRQVNRGERGIRLIKPARGQRVGHEHVTTVFDLMQTSGEPQPVRLERKKYGGKPQPESWRALASLALRGVPGADRAEWVDWFVRTHAGVGEMAAALELVRRMSAALVAEGTVGSESRLTGKVEAESVAFLCVLRLGLDTDGFAFPYVASWAGTDDRSRPGEIVAAVGERILVAARQAFACIDTNVATPVRVLLGPRLASRDRPPEQAAAASATDAQVVRVLEEAGSFFVECRPESWVSEYLAERGFSEDIQRQWCIGYAPADWTTLTDHLRGLGYGDPAIEASGLAKRSSRGTLIDVFRDRAVFPVRSMDGTVTGFIGRAAPGAASDAPKYLNCRETELYRKGQVLLGLWEGREALAAGARAVIVEGPLDANAVTSATGGRYVGVAPCGTALTADHIALLGKAVDLDSAGLLVAFDADPAGQKAALRAYELLHDRVEQPMIVEFPDGQDPAGLLCSHGTDALTQALDASQRPLVDVVIDATIAKYGHWLEFDEGKFNALHAAAPHIARLPTGQVAGQVARVADQLGLTHAEVTGAVTDAAAASVLQTSNQAGLPRRTPSIRAGPDTAGLEVAALAGRRPGTSQRASPRRR